MVLYTPLVRNHLALAALHLELSDHSFCSPEYQLLAFLQSAGGFYLLKFGKNIEVPKHPYFPKPLLQNPQGWFIISLETEGFWSVQWLHNRKQIISFIKSNGLQAIPYWRRG